MSKTFVRIISIFSVLLVNVSIVFAQEPSRMSGTVEFVVNTDEIIQNGDYYHFIHSVLPFLERNADYVENVVLVGSASPDGSEERNVYLSHIRAEKIYSYIKDFIPRSKLSIDNEPTLFLKKTGLDGSDYPKLRATYIEVRLSNSSERQITRDTVYVERVDTIYKEVEKPYTVLPLYAGSECKPILSVYNDLLGDLLFRANIGVEVYFNKMSFFVEGSFSNWGIIGKTYNIDIWHTGLRKYFNNDYEKLFIEIHANAGYFDTDLFGSGKVGILYGGGIGCGYVFNLGKHWKIAPIVRIGLYEKVYYMDYEPSDGNINISFGNYTDGKGGGNVGASEGANGVIISKAITSEFLEKSNKGYYIGPTYVGVTLKRNFCVNKKNKRQIYEKN